MDRKQSTTEYYMNLNIGANIKYGVDYTIDNKLCTIDEKCSDRNSVIQNSINANEGRMLVCWCSGTRTVPCNCSVYLYQRYCNLNVYNVNAELFKDLLTYTLSHTHTRCACEASSPLNVNAWTEQMLSGVFLLHLSSVVLCLCSDFAQSFCILLCYTRFGFTFQFLINLYNTHTAYMKKSLATFTCT